MLLVITNELEEDRPKRRRAQRTKVGDQDNGGPSDPEPLEMHREKQASVSYLHK